MEVIHIAVPSESYVAAIYSILLPFSIHPQLQRDHPWSLDNQSHNLPPPPILKLIDQGEDVLIDRRCIGTGTVSLVTLIIWSFAQIPLKLHSFNQYMHLQMLRTSITSKFGYLTVVWKFLTWPPVRAGPRTRLSEGKGGVPVKLSWINVVRKLLPVHLYRCLP